MRLRSRLVLSVVLVALPVALLTTVFENVRERRRAGENLRERTLARVEGFAAADCEADPFSFPNVGTDDPGDWLFGAGAAPHRIDPPGIRYFVLDRNAHPFREDAPRIPPRVARAFEAGESPVFAGRRGRARVDYAIVRPDWDSPVCAALLVERPLPKPQPLGSRLVPALLVTIAVVLSVLLVAGPVVRRIRKLTDAVARGDARGTHDDAGDELGELGRAFAAREATIASQLDELSSREAALREHLAATSHDILLPITVLQGHLVEVERVAVAGGEVDLATVRGALEETHYVASLVRDLNADARLRSGLVVVSEVDLGALVERARARHAPIARHAAIALEVAVPEAPLVVSGDPTLIEQMISNLVHNAVRYGVPGGHVAVVLEPTTEGFELVVADDGPGVPEAHLAMLGDRGFRTDEARTRRPEGMGLGLHIVREVCAKHGFSLAFARGEESGLVVRVRGGMRGVVD